MAIGGASGYAPENTLKAFTTAIRLGCPWLELDVHYTAGELVVIHDQALDRTTNGTGLIKDVSFTYWRSLDTGEAQQIPTLKEVLALVKRRALVNIKLKGANTANSVNQLLDQFLKLGWQPQDCLISSFKHTELALADPKYPRGVLFHEPADDLARAMALDAWSITLEKKACHPSAGG